AATSGASNDRTHMPRATSRAAVSGASWSSKPDSISSPLLDGPDLDLGGLHRGRPQKGRRGVQRGEAGDAPLDGRSPHLESVLEHRTTTFAGVRVDVRHRVDDEGDLSARDDVEHGRALVADLSDDTRREARLAQ